ncbi:hypothetical protein M099_2403 [Phocaeicola vulgatus str. 3975 RP4]|uniref:Uncharacterized protein n=1 Tax=Phocaeicola vulgatus str. 3975 RP4 TaxID=1339352 RepID=A0A069SGG3_PHOVU|nr:hypothetical protein M099_2403 [Phocaeicola vulgatus str. 3975 RP4]
MQRWQFKQAGTNTIQALNNEILSISKKNSSRQWKTHLN